MDNISTNFDNHHFKNYAIEHIRKCRKMFMLANKQNSSTAHSSKIHTELYIKTILVEREKLNVTL